MLPAAANIELVGLVQLHQRVQVYERFLQHCPAFGAVCRQAQGRRLHHWPDVILFLNSLYILRLDGFYLWLVRCWWFVPLWPRWEAMNGDALVDLPDQDIVDSWQVEPGKDLELLQLCL